MSKKTTSRRSHKNYIPKELNLKLLDQAKLSNDDILISLNTSIHGLVDEQLSKNIEIYGHNVLDNKKRYHWYHSLWDALISPFALILLVIAILNIFMPDNGPTKWISFGIVMGLLVITTIIKTFQEVRSNKASSKLQEMVKTTTLVERNGIKAEIPVANLVPGDIVHLAAGDMIPADMMILFAKDLFVTQSALTGESEPVEKTVGVLNNKDFNNALEANNLCFMGTSVASGTARGVVLNTAINTYFGRIAKTITKRRPKTNFDKGIRRVSWLLLITTLIMTIVVFVLQGSLGNGWLNATTFSLALAVGLTPEMLPMIVTLNLAKQAFKLSKQKTIVKNINSIQNFGAMDILCTDKTGTLTEDRIILERHMNVAGKEDDRVLVYGFLNSQFQTGLKNLLDVAIIDKAKSIGLDNSADAFEKIDEIPFDFQRRRMSVVLSEKNNKTKQQIITKGAIEEILSVCTCAELNGKTVKLDSKLKTKIMKTIELLNSEGMRVIAIAVNTKPLPIDRQLSVKDENDMKLIGYVALLDPPKLSARKAILDLQRKGVAIKVLTGDNDAVAKYICGKVGIKIKNILLGSQIETMTDEELKDKVMKINVFAKLSPEQKARVVYAIKANKHVVGYMGDGINDAAAMRVADISISVDTAVDIAKETADIILLEKDLTILGHGCVEGRKTYSNIIKYIKITVSSNFGNMLSMLVASIWLSNSIGQPMSAVQILILNLIYDFAQFSVPWDNVDDEFIKSPKSWDSQSILKFMLVMGPVSSLFDISTFIIMYYGLGWNNGANTLNFQTGWFFVSLLTQTMVLIVLRTRKIPLIQSFPSTPVVLSSIIIILLGLMLVLVGADPIFASLRFTTGYILLGCAFAITSCYVVMAQLAKTCYVKAFNAWL